MIKFVLSEYGTCQEDVLPPFSVETELKLIQAGAPAFILLPREERLSENAAKMEEVEPKDEEKEMEP